MGESEPGDVVAAAAALGPLIREAREELDESRQLPSHIAQALTQAGLFQLNLPRALGGMETDPLTSYLAVEELSKIDGSVGWCTYILSSSSHFMGWLTPEAAREIIGQPPDIRASGSLRPEGKAIVVEGGYRVAGHWDFASGIDHANWLLCTCKINNDHGPILKPDGAPVTRTLLLPADMGTIHDTWSVVGMRGTGSKDFVVEDQFVPAERSFSWDDEPYDMAPLFNRRFVMVAIWALNVATSLGMARGAIDAFVDLAGSLGSTSSPTLLRDRPSVQATVGQAEAIVSGARTYVLDAICAAWNAICEDVPDPGPQIVQARLAIFHALHEAVRAVDLLFHAAGTNSIRRKHHLERFFRDTHVAVQNAAGLSSNVESAGRVILGLRPSGPGW